MRIGIIADVHGNLEALRAVLGELKERGADKIVCLGDMVGYGADPEACCEILRSEASLCLLGNHDAAVAGLYPLSDFNEMAYDAAMIHRKLISPETHAWLASLPYEQIAGEAGHTTAYCHGSPICPEDFQYLTSGHNVAECVEGRPDLKFAGAIFFGHSHLPLAFEVAGDKITRVDRDDEIQLRHGRQYYFSVPSVGQPRDWDPRAGCGLYEAAARTFDFVRVEYDIETAARKILDRGLPPELAHRLHRGV